MNDPEDAWAELKASPLWSHWREHPALKPHRALIERAEDESFGLPAALKAIGALRVTVAIHAPDNAPSDWSLIADVGAKSDLLGSLNLLDNSLKSSGLEVSRLGEGDTAVRKLSGPSLAEPLYLALTENLLVVAAQPQRVRQLRDQPAQPHFSRQPEFAQVEGFVDASAPLNLFVQHERLNHWLLGPASILEEPSAPPAELPEPPPDMEQASEEEALDEEATSDGRSR
jgi:hypothetical protein